MLHLLMRSRTVWTTSGPMSALKASLHRLQLTTQQVTSTYLFTYYTVGAVIQPMCNMAQCFENKSVKVNKFQ